MIGIAQGWEVAAIIAEAGLGAIVFTAVVVSFGTGYVIGTFIYNAAGDLIYYKLGP